MSSDSYNQPGLLMSPSNFLPKAKKQEFGKHHRASPSVIGPKTPDLPSLHRGKHGDFQIQPFNNSSPNFSTNEVEKHKLESDCIRYKLMAEDAIEAKEKIEKKLKLSNEECSQLKINLNAERERHAQTAEESRALSHLAAQLRSKSEKIEKVNERQNTELKLLKKRAETAEQDMVTQTSRVDALTKICQALESQLRQMALEKGCTEAKADIAAKWRQEAYKYLVQMSYTESTLTAENRKLKNAISNAKNNTNTALKIPPTSQKSKNPPRDFTHSKNKSF